MAVVNFSGLQGSGKSYFVVQSVVIPACRIGRTVVTNIPLRDDLLKADFPAADIRYFNIDDWVQNPALVNDVPYGAVLIIDEAWRLFPAGQKSNNAPLPFKSLISEHRHRVGENGFALEIVTITQDIQSDLSAYVRAKTDRTHLCTKLSALGASNRFVVDVYMRAISAEKPNRRQHVKKLGPFKYSPDVYQYYQSQTQTEADEHGTEQTQGVSVVVWKRPLFWFWTPLVLVAGIWALSWLIGFFRGGVVEPKSSLPPAQAQFVPIDQMPGYVPPVASPPAPPALSVAKSPPAAAAPPAGASAGLPASARWRVAGVLEHGDGSVRVVLTDGEYTRLLDRARDCRVNRYGETECDVEGECVTQFSGRSRAASAPAADVSGLMGFGFGSGEKSEKPEKSI